MNQQENERGSGAVITPSRQSDSMRKGRVLYFDVLNVAACISVIILHFNGLAHSYSNTMSYFQALAAECLFFWAVPVFLMLTGATLMDYRKRYSSQVFFKKRLVRTVFPFIAWSLLALAWKVSTNQMDSPVGPRSFVDVIFNTKIIDVYWFFIPLFSIYLMIPILSLFIKRDNFNVLRYTVLIYFLINSVLPLCCELTGIPFNGNLTISIFSGYVIFPVLGYYFSNHEITPTNRIVLYVSSIILVVFRYLVIAINEGASSSLVWSYLSPIGIVQGAAVFVFAKHFNWSKLFSNSKRRQFLAKLSSCSFGIYLIHMIVFYYGLVLTHLNGGSLAWRTIGPLVAYCVCLVIVLVGKKIPIIRRLFP